MYPYHSSPWLLFGAEKMNIHNRFKIKFSVSDISVFLHAVLKILEVHFLYFPLRAAMHLSCWLVLLPPQRASTFTTTNSTDPGFTIRGFFNYTEANLDLTCIECTSTKLTEMIEDVYRLGENSSDSLSELIDLIVESDATGAFFKQSMAEAKARCPINPSTWGAFNPCGADSITVPPFLANETWLANRTGRKCDNTLSEGLRPEEEVGHSKRDGNAVFFNIAFLSFSVLTLISFVIARVRLRYKAQAWKKQLPYSGKQFLRYIKKKEKERGKISGAGIHCQMDCLFAPLVLMPFLRVFLDDYLDETMPPLSQSLFVPAVVRVLVPVVIVANILLFVVAHCGTSAIISFEVNIGGDHFMIDRIFMFNFQDGLRNTFENGGYEMAILLLIFGGVWPYFRCALSLVLWFTPPHHLSSRLRGRFFLWIDAMNKLTVRDILKFMVILAIFFMYAGGPYIFNQGKGDLYSLTILAWPGPAMYCGLIAMILSRVSSRFLLDFHYRAVDGARDALHKERVGDISKAAAQGEYLSDYESQEGSIDSDISLPEKLAPESKTGMNKTRSAGTKNTSAGRQGHAGKPLDESETSKISTEDSSDASSEDSTDQRTIKVCGRRVLLGTVGIVLGIVAILLLLIIGLVYFPAVSMDLSSILELFLESGTTYENAVSEFGAYAFICAVLIKARLAVESKSDYAAVVILGVILVIAISAVGWFFFLKYVSDVSMNWKRLIFSEHFLKERKKRKKEGELTMMPTYLRLKATEYSEVYVMAYVIGIYQLGAVTIYAVLYFCNFLDTLYSALSFVGIITSTDGECWEAQMGQSHNIIVCVGCFVYLTVMFMQQLYQQRQLNIDHARKFLLQVQKEKAWTKEIEELHAKEAEHGRSRERGSKVDVGLAHRLFRR
jgi:hypothetical protein